jgi:hypothetical protein
MYDLSPSLFVHIGLIIRLLHQAHGFEIGAIITESEKLTNSLTKADFAVSSEGLCNLKLFLDELKKEGAPNRMITSKEVQRMSEIMHVVELMVFAEAQTKKIYILTESRFSLDSLINKPWQMFAKGVFICLPKMAAYDISEAFMCIVLSRATATAFHILRATEATLLAYYCQVVKRGRVKQTMWGNMVNHLRTRRNPDESLLQRLDYIRNTYRNPTSHPEASYTIEQAQDLLGLCIDVINAMSKTLPKTQPPS